MANIKSQKKRALKNAKQNLVNNSERTHLKHCIKNVLTAVEAKDKDNAVKALNECNKYLDKAVVDGIKHQNYASRQKARLAKAVATLG